MLRDNLKDRDAELLSAVRNAPEGDLRAFEELVQRYRKQILADCRYLTGDVNNSEDLAQDVCVKAFFGLRRFEGRCSFRRWLQQIEVHHCLNHLRKRGNREDIALDEQAMKGLAQLRVPPAVDEEMAVVENRRRITAVLNAMPSTLRNSLVLREIDELSYKEIAGKLGIGISAAKMRIKRAREQFRRLYLDRGQRGKAQPPS